MRKKSRRKKSKEYLTINQSLGSLAFGVLGAFIGYRIAHFAYAANATNVSSNFYYTIDRLIIYHPLATKIVSTLGVGALFSYVGTAIGSLVDKIANDSVTDMVKHGLENLLDRKKKKD